jgi:hypothetical protein
MPEPKIYRNVALREYEVKETPDGKPVIFSIKFVKKNGELVFIPRAKAAGLRFNIRENKMRGAFPVDLQDKPSGHVTPFHIDGMLEWNSKQIKM